MNILCDYGYILYSTCMYICIYRAFPAKQTVFCAVKIRQEAYRFLVYNSFIHTVYHFPPPPPPL